MAQAYLTLADVAKLNGSDASVGLIEENLNYAPELSVFPARTITGISFKTLQRTAFPTTQFRNVNEGVASTKSAYANKLVECFYLDGQMEMDVAAAQACEFGESYALALEASGHASAAILKIGSQIWYGTGSGGDAKGFPGATSIVDAAFKLDATGTTASTGSSVFGVKLGIDKCSLIFGLGSVLQVGTWQTQFITRASVDLKAWKNSLSGYIGMQWVNKNALCQAYNLTAQAGKGCTDALLAQLLSKLPVNFYPDYWFMSPRSRFQLQTSRSAVSTALTGSQPLGFAPLPIESNGIPIITTNSLLNTEAIV